MTTLSVAALLLRSVLGVRAMSTAADQVWAKAIKYRSADKVLEVEFNSGDRFTYPAEYLRVHSPAAEARDRLGRPRVVSGRRHVGLVGVHPVGSYAVRLDFDDLHCTGIYTWPYLHELGQCKLSRMRQYIRTLRERGLSREPPSLGARRPAAGSVQQQQPPQQQGGGGQQPPQQGGGEKQQGQEEQQQQQQQQQQYKSETSGGAVKTSCAAAGGAAPHR